MSDDDKRLFDELEEQLLALRREVADAFDDTVTHLDEIRVTLWRMLDDLRTLSRQATDELERRFHDDDEGAL